jgi:magnesium chelatase family protein
MTPQQIREFCVLDAEGTATLKAAMEAFGLSARAHDRILRVARTIADLAASETLRHEHIAEAISFRTLDRKYWDA